MANKEKNKSLNALVGLYIRRGDAANARRAAWLGGRSLTTKEINSLVKRICSKGGVNDALEIAKLGSSKTIYNVLFTSCLENETGEDKIQCVKKVAKTRKSSLTTKEVDLLIQSCLKEHDFYSASAAAKLEGRKLSFEEKNALVKFYIQQEDWFSLELALKIIKQGVSQKERNQFVKLCIKKEWIDYALKGCKLGVPKKIINSLVRLCIEKGDIDNAFKAVRLAGRHITQREIDLLIKNIIQHDYVNWVWRVDVLVAAKFGASKKVLDMLIKSYIKEGHGDYALEIAKLENRDLTPQEVDSLVAYYIKEGLTDYAIDAAAMGKRKLTTKEVSSLVKSYSRRGEIEDAIRAAEIENRKLTPQEIQYLMKVCIRKQRLNDIVTLVKLRGTKLTLEEINTLRESVGSTEGR